MTKVKTTNISGIGGLQQLARQVNENFSRITRAINTPQSVQIYYDDNHTLARVIIGQIPGTGRQIIAISKEGTDVLRALAKSPINESDFIFSSDIINDRADNLEDMIGAVVEVADATYVLFGSIEGINNSLLSSLNSKISKLRALKQDSEK